jgi:hypothetical protein
MTNKECGKPLKTKDGADRGLCSRGLYHRGKHSNGTCMRCGVRLASDNTSQSALIHPRGCCRNCMRAELGQTPVNTQHAGQFHVFPCGCGGILPKTGSDDKFARRTSGGTYMCRVSLILTCSWNNSKRDGHIPISPDTPHSIIRRLMEELNCERCGESLIWEFGSGRTPHLHHNHLTGEIYGFTHPICNPRALEQEIERLRADIKFLRGVINAS